MPDFFKRARASAPAEPPSAPPTGLLERGRLHARLRRGRRLRERLLLELGALVFELHRQGRRAPDLLQAKAAELDAVDREVRALDEALDEDAALPAAAAGASWRRRSLDEARQSAAEPAGAGAEER